MPSTPSTRSSRQSQKAETRRLLKEAAMHCYSEAGLEETSVAAITLRAGVAHGTFYVHFPSKEALLEDLLRDFNQSLLAALEPVWAQSESDPEALVRRSAEVFLASWEAQRSFVEVYARRLEHGMPLAALRDGINPEVEEFLRARVVARWGEAAGGGALRLVVQGMLALWARIGLQVLFGPGVDRAEAIEMLVHMTLGVLDRLAQGLPGRRV